MGNNGGVYTWSQNAAANATADNTVNWQEGQAPSSINDSGRAMMASMAKFRDDISGLIVTTGISTAYVLASNQDFDSLSDLHGKVIAFTPHVTNGASPTLIVDGLGPINLRGSSGQNLPGGVLLQGTPYAALYNNTNGEFTLQGFFGNPYGIPVAAGIDYWAPVTPNSSFAFPVGQQVSRSIYSTLFSLIGTTYGSGDGSSTFNLPDKTGRASVMRDPGGLRVTGNTFNSTDMGGYGGIERIVLVTGNLPPYTPTGVVGTTTSATVGQSLIIQASSGSEPTVLAPVNGGNQGNASGDISLTSISTFAGNGQGGSSAPFTNIQPSIICNYIMRII